MNMVAWQSQIYLSFLSRWWRCREAIPLPEYLPVIFPADSEIILAPIDLGNCEACMSRVFKCLIRKEVNKVKYESLFFADVAFSSMFPYDPAAIWRPGYNYKTHYSERS